MEYKKGSIISAFSRISKDVGDQTITTTVHTISIVHKIIGNELYCKQSVCSIDGEEYKHTVSVFPQYEGELSEYITLVSGNEFDIIIDSGLIPLKEFKDVAPC